MKKPHLFRFLLVVAVHSTSFIGGQIEARRMSVPLPGAATTPQPVLLNTAAILADVKLLSGADFEGRKTGTPGNLKAQQVIEDRFKAIGLTPFKDSFRQPFTFVHKSLKGLVVPGSAYETPYPMAANLIGYIPGTKTPQKFLVISAHYDHLGIRGGSLHPGADDNASGVGTLLALAAWFKANPPAHSIVFAAFDAEELGKQGALAFVAALPFPREQLVMNLNLDMLGHNDENQIFAAGLYHYPFLRPFLDRAISRSTVQVLSGHDRPVYLTGMTDDWTGASDHSAFHDAGVPFLYFGVEDHPDYHAPTDTFERLNAGFLGKVAELVLQVALELDRGLGTIGGR